MIFVRTSGFVRILYEELQHSGAHQWNLTQWMQSARRDSLAKNYEWGLESLGLSFPDFSLEFVKTDSMDIFYQMLFLPIMQCNTRQAAGRCPVSLSIFFVVCMVAAFGWNCQNALTSAIYVNIHINIMCWSLLQVFYKVHLRDLLQQSIQVAGVKRHAHSVARGNLPRGPQSGEKRIEYNNFSWVTRSYLTSVLLNLNKFS